VLVVLLSVVILVLVLVMLFECCTDTFTYYVSTTTTTAVSSDIDQVFKRSTWLMEDSTKSYSFGNISLIFKRSIRLLALSILAMCCACSATFSRYI